MESLDSEYNDLLKKFDTTISAVSALSHHSAGFPSASSRHYWASVLFTRLSAWGLSILQLLPRSRFSTIFLQNWDCSPITSLARNFSECFIAYFYLAIEETSEEEWQCRWNIFNLHDCLRRKKMFEHLKTPSDELNGFAEQANEIKQKLKNNTFFSRIPKEKQSRYLKAKDLYMDSQDAIMNRAGINSDVFRAFYILWSCHTHTFPMGFYKTGENNRGTGLENISDKRHMVVALDFCTDLAKKAARSHLVLFPHAARGLTSESKKSIFDE